MSEEKPKILFEWWRKGKTEDGNIVNMNGDIFAANYSEALDKINEKLRAEFPDIKWMHGKEVEGNGIKYGPTVQQLKK